MTEYSVFTNPNENLNPKNLTEYLTDCTNTLGRKITKKEKEFIKRGFNITKYSGRDWSWEDFKEVIFKSNAAYRQMLLKLKPIIEKTSKFNPARYKFKGLYTDQKLTNQYMGLGDGRLQISELDTLLSYVRHEPIMMHNIVLNLRCDELYQKLVEHGTTPNPQNHTIHVNVSIDPRMSTTVELSAKNTMTVRIGCTHEPIRYSNAGFITLSSLCGRIIQYLTGLSHCSFSHQPTQDWVFVHVDFNKDSIRHDFQTNPTLNTVLGHVAIYKHDFPDKSSCIRLDDRVELNTTMTEEMNTPKFQKASEL